MPTGDKLQFALEYSPDGETWGNLPQYLTERQYDRRLRGTPRRRPRRASASGASDGFLTATATSAPFVLEGQEPVAFILEPKDGARFTEGRRVDLAGGSATSSGPGEGLFHWFVDGMRIEGDGPSLEWRADTVGDGTRSGSGWRAPYGTSIVEITVTVLPDYDRDGIPNDWEFGYRLSPLDGDDAATDPDGDGLSTYAEFRHGLDPTDADSDDDGVSGWGGVHPRARTRRTDRACP